MSSPGKNDKWRDLSEFDIIRTFLDFLEHKYPILKTIKNLNKGEIEITVK